MLVNLCWLLLFLILLCLLFETRGYAVVQASLDSVCPASWLVCAFKIHSPEFRGKETEMSILSARKLLLGDSGETHRCRCSTVIPSVTSHHACPWGRGGVLL